MTSRLARHLAVPLLTVLALFTTSCSHGKEAAPTQTEVTLEQGVFTVAQPGTFRLARVESRSLPTVLTASGTVSPDVNRTIHVTSLGSGRVVELNARLGDQVRKGQILLSIASSDLGSANSDYQKARADEELSRKALDRAQLLYSHGALAEKDLQVALDTEDKAKVDLQTTAQHVRILGGAPDHPASIIQLRAPVSGVIVEQNVAGAEGIKSLDNSPSLFTIADLSEVWILSDVYENDLGSVRLGDAAEIRLNPFPDRVFRGRVADISRVLDPNTRSAKVRVVLPNSDGSLRPGMYATAIFRSRQLRPQLIVPSTAIMRLQDKDWVFRKEEAEKDGSQRFRQIEVHTTGRTEDGSQQIAEGSVRSGQEIILNALEFSAAMAAQASSGTDGGGPDKSKDKSTDKK
jgi:cobalt-zinc-cadmium efflux system membrane fusion protein